MKRFIVYAFAIICVSIIFAHGSSWDNWVRVMTLAAVIIAVPAVPLWALHWCSEVDTSNEAIKPVNVWGRRPHEDGAHG